MRGEPRPRLRAAAGPDLNAALGTNLEIITGEGACDAQIAVQLRFAQLLVLWFNDPGGSAAVPRAASHSPFANLRAPTSACLPADDYPLVADGSNVVGWYARKLP